MQTQPRSLHIKLSTTLAVVTCLIFGIFLFRSADALYQQKLELVSRLSLARTEHIKSSLNKLIKDSVRDAEIIFNYSKLEDVSISTKLKEFDHIQYLVFIDPNTKNFEFIGVDESRRPAILSRLLKYIKYEVGNVEFEAYLLPNKEGLVEPRIFLTFYMPKLKKNAFIAIRANQFQKELIQDDLSQSFLFDMTKKEFLLRQEEIPFKDFSQLERMYNSSVPFLDGVKGDEDKYIYTKDKVEELGLAIITVTPNSYVEKISDDYKKQALVYLAFLILVILILNFIYFSNIKSS